MLLQGGTAQIRRLRVYQVESLNRLLKYELLTANAVGRLTHAAYASAALAYRPPFTIS